MRHIWPLQTSGQDKANLSPAIKPDAAHNEITTMAPASVLKIHISCGERKHRAQTTLPRDRRGRPKLIHTGGPMEMT
jgi:hypothetical protein